MAVKTLSSVAVFQISSCTLLCDIIVSQIMFMDVYLVSKTTTTTVTTTITTTTATLHSIALQPPLPLQLQPTTNTFQPQLQLHCVASNHFSIHQWVCSAIHDIWKVFYMTVRIFRNTSLSILVFVNNNCCLCKCFTELYFLSWLLVVSFAIF